MRRSKKLYETRAVLASTINRVSFFMLNNPLELSASVLAELGPDLETSVRHLDRALKLIETRIGAEFTKPLNQQETK